MITFDVNDQSITLVEAEGVADYLVSGTVNNYKCHFNFNEVWEGYTKTAVFMFDEENCSCSKKNTKIYSVILDENNECYIPQAAVKDEGKIRIGVYGSNTESTLPTVYSVTFLVRLGAEPDDAEPPPDEQRLFEQLLRQYNRTIQFIETIEDKLLPVGGETNQVLTKKSNDDYDYQWETIGAGTDFYEFTQLEASDEWFIEHNLGKHPSVTVVDSGESVVVGDVTYINLNSLIINFASEFSGKAYLN